MKHLVLFLFVSLFMAAESSAALTTQRAYRWRADNGNEANATWLAGIDETAEALGHRVLRLRVNMAHEQIMIVDETDKLIGNEVDLFLWYAEDPDGPYTRIGSSGSNAFKLSASAYLDNNDPMTTPLLKVIPDYTFVPGKFISSATDDNFLSLGSHQYTEWEFCISPTAHARTGNFYFRLGDSNQEFSLAPVINFDYQELPAIPLPAWAVFLSVGLMVLFFVVRIAFLPPGLHRPPM